VIYRTGKCGGLGKKREVAPQTRTRKFSRKLIIKSYFDYSLVK
jgi:hypothetical protein